MMGLGEIQRINRKATREARAQAKQPAVPTAAQRELFKTGALEATGFRIPFLADYVPKGWKRTDDDPFFVDMSGFGADYEPALSQKQFARKLAELPPDIGVAMIEHGQFQCYVATYRPRELYPPGHRLNAPCPLCGQHWYNCGETLCPQPKKQEKDEHGTAT